MPLMMIMRMLDERLTVMMHDDWNSVVPMIRWMAAISPHLRQSIKRAISKWFGHVPCGWLNSGFKFSQGDSCHVHSLNSCHVTCLVVREAIWSSLQLRFIIVKF